MKKYLFIVFIILAFTSCRKIDLYHDLSEEEANDILVVLQQEGIEASKEKETKQNEVFWVIRVDAKRLSDARRLLVEHNLPRKKELGLTGVYKEKGLIPTPDEQKARYLLALKGEIINSLLKIPDVVDADVVINVPTPDEFASKDEKEKRPTASVVVKAKPTDSVTQVLTESKIQQFVANAVENLNPRDVSVIITYIAKTSAGILPNQTLVLPTTAGLSAEAKKPVTRIAGVEVVSESKGRLKLYLAVFFVLIAVMASGLVFTVIRSHRLRQELEEFKGAAGLIEGKVVEERPRLKRGGE